MNVKKANRDDVKYASVTVSMTKEEKKRLEEASKVIGCTMSTVVKFALNSFYRERQL